MSGPPGQPAEKSVPGKLTDSIAIDGAAGLVRSSDGALEIAGPIELELGDAVGDSAHDALEMRIDGTYIASAQVAVEHREGSWRVAVTPTEVDLRVGELRHRATHDVLTGLANRDAFMAAAAAAIERAETSPSRPAVFFVDLDDFKRVNDTFGHETGDQLLMEVARRLQTTSRPMDTVARFAGDEFLVLCEALPDRAIAHRIAGRMVAALASIVDLEGLQLTASASVGVAMAEAGVDADELVRRADAAMFRAKESSRSVVHYNDVRTSQQVDDGPDQGAVEGAIEDNRLMLRYQAIRRVSDGVLAGLRPAAYMADDHGRPIPLVEVLDRVADPSLVADAGRWVISEAVGQLAEIREHHDARDVRLHLAMRANDILDLGVVGILTTELEAAGVDPSGVVLEVSGDLLGQRVTDVAVPRLHASGVRLAIEGFGRGRSSLALLATQAAELMRLDAALVEDIVESVPRRRTLGALIELAHANSMAAIVTGVTSPVQLGILRLLECDLAEGPVFGEDLRPDELV